VICGHCVAELRELRGTRAKLARLEKQINELQSKVSELARQQVVGPKVLRVAVGFDDGRVGVLNLNPNSNPNKFTANQPKFEAFLSPPEDDGSCEPVASVTALPGGKLIVGHDDGGIKLWIVREKVCAEERSHTADGRSPLEGSAVLAVTQLSDRRVATCAEDRLVRLWAENFSVCEATLVGHTGAVHSCAQLPDGRLVTGGGSGDNSVRIWDIGIAGASCSICKSTLSGHRGAVTAVVPLPDDRLMTASQDETVRVWRISSGECLSTFVGHSQPVTSAVALVDGELAISSSCDGTLRVWRLSDGECISTLEGHLDVVTGVVDLGGGLVCSTSHDGTVRVWATNGGECLSVIQCDAAPCSITALID
jgi:WD40 repeat protein